MLYQAWAGEEGLGGREHRSRDAFKEDIISALGAKGVRHGRRRRHDPARPKLGKGKVRRGFFGVRFKRVPV